MTMPNQERQAIEAAGRFLTELSNPRGPWKGVPSAVRKRAADVVHHFPVGHAWELDPLRAQYVCACGARLDSLGIQ